jgi:hypothetical protein
MHSKFDLWTQRQLLFTARRARNGQTHITFISLICEKLKFHGGLFPVVLHQHECVWYQIKLEKNSQLAFKTAAECEICGRSYLT